MIDKRKKELASNLADIHSGIEKMLKDKVESSYPELICVSKNRPLEDVLLINQLGETEFGENRVQELQKKQEYFMQLPQAERLKYNFNWHFIGTLQRNKVKDVVGLVKLIHSVDSLRLMTRINRVSKQRELISNILLQVNIAEEESKHGFSVAELEEAIDFALTCDNIKLRGLMTMAPYYDDPSQTQVIFHKAQDLLKTYQKKLGQDFNQLSMGMSHDYPYAIAEGATLIRLGSKIFADRNY